MITYMNQLRVFYTVAKVKSLTVAAQQLNVTPPAISRQLKTLEEILELKLVYREGKKIELTNIGDDIYKRLEAVFVKLDDLENYMQDLSNIKKGTLRIGFPQAIAKHLVLPLIEAFRTDFPGVKIILDQGSSLEMIHSVLERKTDIAIIGQVPSGLEEKLEVIKVSKAGSLTLIASLDYPVADEISINEATDQPLIFPPEGSATREAILSFFHKFDLKPKIMLESSAIDFSKEMVKQGKGLAFISTISVVGDLKNKSLKAVRISEGLPEINRWFIYLKNKPLPPSAKAFLPYLDRLDEIESQIPY